jgi:sterol desaturase/sphingolipid hydroxylase (fatty acid hydroxylase superfamily)
MSMWTLVSLPTLIVTLILIIIERRHNPASTDWLHNLETWGIARLTAISVLPLVPQLHYAALVDGAKLPFWLALPLFVVVIDLGEYVFHRAQHRIPFMWAMHSLHHSDPDMNVLTSQRHFWGDQFIKALTIWPASMMIIGPTPAMIGAFGLISLWNLVLHSRLPINFGRLSWLLNTPSYHRRHHSRLPEHYDTNFAALFPIFDVICGTYYRPTSFPPTGLERHPENIAEVVTWPLIWDKKLSEKQQNYRFL